MTSFYMKNLPFLSLDKYLAYTEPISMTNTLRDFNLYLIESIVLEQQINAYTSDNIFFLTFFIMNLKITVMCRKPHPSKKTKNKILHLVYVNMFGN